jgi:SAM-dependent methyltransferase
MAESFPARESLYARLFARFYDAFMSRAEKAVLLRRRRKLLRGLQGRVLEVGSGTGINFSLYSPDVHLLACEPSSAMLNLARARLQEQEAAAQIELMLAGIQDVQLADAVPSASLDAAVCTLVLCTVEDPVQAVEFLHSRLKPGGILVVLEHVRAESKPGQMLQTALNPVWKRFAHGCNLNRDTESLVKKAGFTVLEEDRFSITLPFYQAAFVKSQK